MIGGWSVVAQLADKVGEFPVRPGGPGRGDRRPTAGTAQPELWPFGQGDTFSEGGDCRLTAGTPSINPG